MIYLIFQYFSHKKDFMARGWLRSDAQLLCFLLILGIQTCKTTIMIMIIIIITIIIIVIIIINPRGLEIPS